jgi:hypothetical protein
VTGVRVAASVDTGHKRICRDPRFVQVVVKSFFYSVFNELLRIGKSEHDLDDTLVAFAIITTGLLRETGFA